MSAFGWICAYIGAAWLAGAVLKCVEALGPMTETRMERNRRARAYSHACRIRRLRNALWAVAAVLTVLLAVELIWLLSSRPAPEGTAQEPQEMATLLEPEVTESTGVFTVTGYCACCTPYSHLNRCGDLVLTASGEWVHLGDAVAVDPDIIPLGSTVTISEKDLQGAGYRCVRLCGRHPHVT